MKIMQFVHNLSIGGAETLVKNYALNFDREKNDVVILCLSHAKDSPYENILNSAGVKMIFIEDKLCFKKSTTAVPKIIRNLHKYLLIRKIIRIESPDILHSHLLLCTYIRFARPKKDTVLIDTIHSEPKKVWVDSNGKLRNREFAAVKWLIKKYNMRFVVLHEKMRKEINKMFGVSNSVILNNGIDLVRFRSAKSKSVMRKKLSIPENAFVVGHVGRFSAVKNHEFLIKIFKKMDHPNKFLMMVGEGMEKERVIHELQNERLDGKYLILSNRDDIPDVLSAMDVFVFPSLYEGMPTSLIEAQEAGLPCFISDTITEQVVISNLVSRLPLEDDVYIWAELIDNYRKPEKIIVNDENWDIRKITKQLEKIYEGALAEKRNGEK